jgi:2,3-dihydroxybenzoate-AMP ligase
VKGFVPWPAELARKYRDEGLWSGVPLGEALDAAARAHGDRIAIVDGDRRVDFAELRRRARRLASGFARRGICDGAPIVFQLPNSLELAVAYLAALKVGAIPIACLPHHREAEIGSIADLAEARAWLIASTSRKFDYLTMARRLRPEIASLRDLIVVGPCEGSDVISFDALVDEGDEDDPKLAEHIPDPASPAVLQLSGGTTGIPKLIPRTHEDYAYNSLAFAEASGFTRDDVLLLGIPVAHNFPLACPGLQGAILLGARTVLAPSPAPEVVFPLVERERVTWIPAVPATLIQWSQHPSRASFDLSSIRAIYVGGQRLNPEPARAANDVFGPVVRQVFGMAEGLLCCTRPDDPTDIHVETQGRPVSTLAEIRIVDDDGRDVPAGEIGELLCRGPYTLRGYFRADEHNAKTFTSDGFYRTGDVVRLHPSGNLVVEGRKKDLINRGGEKISAEEIENLMLKHPAIANAALVAVSDPVLGERGCACVVLREGANLDLPQLVSFLRDEHRIAVFKIPERLEVFEKLPLTGVGKVSKKDLRELVRVRVASSSA